MQARHEVTWTQGVSIEGIRCPLTVKSATLAVHADTAERGWRGEDRCCVEVDHVPPGLIFFKQQQKNPSFRPSKFQIPLGNSEVETVLDFQFRPLAWHFQLWCRWTPWWGGECLAPRRHALAGRLSQPPTKSMDVWCISPKKITFFLILIVFS